MPKLAKILYSGPNTELYVQLGSLIVLLSLVVTVLGIKFKWFKHRLSFESIPNANITGIGSSLDQNQITPGVFRWRNEDENYMESPVTLPPVRDRKLSSGPPPPLLPQKRTIVPKPPGQELIPETPQIEQTTPPFVVRNNRKTLPLEVDANNRPTSYNQEPHVPKRTKKLRPKSLNVLIDSNIQPMNRNLIAEKHNDQKEVSNFEKRQHFQVEESINSLQTEIGDLINLRFEEEKNFRTEKEVEFKDLDRNSFQSEKNNSNLLDFEANFKDFSEEKDQGNDDNIQRTEIVQDHANEIMSIQKDFEDLLKHEMETDPFYFEAQRILNIQQKHKFERRDTGFVSPNLVRPEGDQNYNSIGNVMNLIENKEKEFKIDLKKNIVIVTDEEEVKDVDLLEKKDLAPAIVIFEAEETENESYADSTEAKAFPSPRASKGISSKKDLDDLDFEKTDEPLPQNPLIVDIRPVPRERTAYIPPLPKSPPPEAFDRSNGNWTAIEIHRNLTKELNAELIQVVSKKSDELTSMHASEATKEVKEEAEAPKNMRDMMRSRQESNTFSGF